MNTDITKLNISGKSIKSLKEINWDLYPNLKILYCALNQLTSLKYCPSNLQELYCSNNELSSLKHCPTNLKILHCNQ